MEEELNYLSEKIEDLENNIAGMYDRETMSKEYKEAIKEKEKELELLNNIMSILTFNEFI